MTVQGLPGFGGEFPVSGRLKHVLSSLGVTTAADLLRIDRATLAALPYVGAKTLDQFDRLVVQVRNASSPRSAGRPSVSTISKPDCLSWYPLGSVLALSPHVIISRIIASSEEADPSLEQLPLGDLNLSEKAIRELRALALWPEDSAEVLACISLGYLARDCSVSTTEEILDALSWLYGVPRQSLDADIIRAANVRLDMCDGSTHAGIPWLAFGYAFDEHRVLTEALGPTPTRIVGKTEADVLRGSANVAEGLRLLALIYTRAYPAMPQVRGELACQWGMLASGHLGEAIASVLAGALGDRQTSIFLARCGLGRPGARGATLEELGQEFGLTRERVRQLFHRAAENAVEILPRTAVWQLLSLLIHVIGASLGVCTLEWAAQELSRLVSTGKPFSVDDLRVLLTAAGRPDWVHDDVLKHPDHCPKLVSEVRSRAVSLAGAHPSGRSVSDFAFDLQVQRWDHCTGEHCMGRASEVPTCGRLSSGSPYIPESYLKAVLSSVVPPMVDGMEVVAPDVWCLRHGRFRREVVAAALRLLGRPVHYSELAAYVREQNEHLRDISDRNIHACLTTYPEFVPTARGTYALQQSVGGCVGPERHITTAEAIIRLLEQRGCALTATAILEALEPQGYLRGNIEMALHTHSAIVEVGHRVFDLADRVNRRHGRKPVRLHVVKSDRRIRLRPQGTS